MLAAVWLLLFLHNFPYMPAAAGYDGSQHLQYAQYIQEHHRLPGAGEGWEMFQPPLYYFLGAKLLDLAHLGAFEPSGMMLMRFLGLAIGAVNLALIFAGLRLLFPDDWKKTWAGLVLAAFLPAQVCLLHYLTNETLSAMLVTAALCVGLLLLRAERPWWGWHGVLGIALGLALLSKVSAILAIPAVLGALSLKLVLRRERAPRVWLGVIGAPLLISLLIGGWHYLDLWHDYGNPFTGNWNTKVAEPWWQAKGFHTPVYYFSFGESLVRPFFSGFYSFWDGLYSTLWGDGLLGGRINPGARAPWNYDLMTVGYVLALLPTALVLTGLIRALIKCFRAASLAWLSLVALVWLFAFALLGMSLKVPSYAEVKAFYALPILLPLCAFGALGFEFWSSRGRVARCLCSVGLGIWLVNVYASFWIRPDTLLTELSSAIAANVYLKGDSYQTFLNVVNHYPGDSQAVIWLASVESQKNPEQSVKRLEQALQNDPDNAWVESYLARDLARCNRLDEAVVHAQRAARLAPEDEVLARTWCMLALRHKDYNDAVAAGRHTLGLSPTDVGAHLLLGMALLNLQQVPEAIRHLSAVVTAKPELAEAQFYLGVCLLDQPAQRDAGLAHLREAVRLDPKNTEWQTALQKALKGS